eukprot:1161661-Amorphochlora_amoeboformis.AAC.2
MLRCRAALNARLRLGITGALRRFSTLPDHEILTMPALSPTMEVGTISKWQIGEGDFIESGSVIADVETDKAVVAFEAVDEVRNNLFLRIKTLLNNLVYTQGYLAKIIAAEGTADIAIGSPVAVKFQNGSQEYSTEPNEKQVIVEEKESISAFKDYVHDGTTPAPAESKTDSPAPEPTPAAATPVVETEGAPPKASGERIFASPLARSVAAEMGIDLAQIGTDILIRHRRTPAQS